MPSILSNNNQMPATNTNNPADAVKNLIGQILSSANPQQTFNQILANNQQAQEAMNLINQYGNGDPKTAFMNYAANNGKQNLAQQILQKFGLS